jgi:hypothetical protein
LGFETLENGVDLITEDVFIQRDKEIRAAQITIVLDDFIFQDEVLSKRVPSQLGQQPVILVQIVSIMGKDQIGHNVAVFRQKPQYRAAASNLDIIAVGTEAQFFFSGVTSSLVSFKSSI